MTNPLVASPPGKLYNADQSIFLDSDGTMYLYYSTTDNISKNIYVISSNDGWKSKTQPKVLFTTVNAASKPLVSTVLRDPDNGLYYLWQVDAAREPHFFVRYTSQSPAGPFVSKVQVSLNNLPPNLSPWEQNVLLSPDGKFLYGLVTLSPTSENSPDPGLTSLFFLYSRDWGQSWTVAPGPIFTVGPGGSWDDLLIYRATLAASPSGRNQFDLWYSGADKNQTWHVGYARATIED